MQEEIYRIILEDALSGYWDWHIPSNVEYLSPAFKAMLGYEDHEMENRPESWQNLMIEDDLPLLSQNFRRHVETRGQARFEQEVRFRHRYGHTIYVICSGRVIEWDEQFNPVRMVGCHIDITRQKEAEINLKKMERLLQRTNQMAWVGGWEVDLPTRRLFWTPVTREIHEVDEDYVPDFESAVNFFKEGENRARLISAFEAAVNHGVPYDLELQIITAKGRERWTRAMGNADFVNGVCVRVYGAFQDITEHKNREEMLRQQQESLIGAKEQAEKATRAKSQFLSTMSHEIRTPLNAVVGFTNILLQNPREDQHEYLRLLKFSSENLLGLVNDILDFNKIEAGKLVLEEVDFNLSELLGNIRQAMLPKALEKGIGLNLIIDGQMPRIVKGDPIRIGQIITNLVSNAIKFTSVGQVVLSAKVLKKTGEEIRLHFRVTDTGIGIPADKLGHIFESFGQANADTTRQYGGTGLGLTITRRLLNMQGTDIRVESTPGKGSAFFFDLRLKPGTGKEVRPKTVSLQPPGRSLQGVRVLMAEDNQVNVTLAKYFFKRWGMECDVVENGLLAVQKVQEKPYDLVLMDLQMPQMDGYQATIVIRRLEEDRFRQLPIIALTASAELDIKDKAMMVGMNDFVSKPFNPEELFGTIEKFTRRDVALEAGAA
ncbi:PAS domain-containing hybrid sensor histidine kinase/response regulator [Larkinella soli]|uniref:PAS domain-containing hybrid sensor histidine kinase/response regulator n=1 Tax=Larkinella soli TaxID=1770527 RepID=UPI000FFB27F0|nr:PAS domain-containing hybrid sensor histidine kinase/response regulator [Larkinella soli]